MIRMLLLLLLQAPWLAGAQQLRYNYAIDTAEGNVRAALHFYQRYLDGFRKDSLPDFRQFWSQADCRDYHRPDQLLFGIASDYPTYCMGNSRTVLFVKPEGDLVHIKTQFARADSPGQVSVFAITNHYIRVSPGGRCEFINPVALNGRAWRQRQTGQIRYFFPAYHRFNAAAADSLQRRVAALRKEWGLPPIDIRYYFADNREEIQQLRGFDYSTGMGNRSKPTGISDDVDNLVYCAGWGENYFHEVVHIYLNRLYPESPLREGLAVFYGGSLGHGIGWHQPRMQAYLAAHPETDPAGWYALDNFTNPNSVLLGIICRKTYEKEGITGLRRIMRYKSMDELYANEYGLKAGESPAPLLRSLINR